MMTKTKTMRARRTPKVNREDSPTAARGPKRRVTTIPLAAAVDAIPTNWLDSLLTGPDAVIGKAPYTGRDIQNLLLAVQARIRRLGSR